MIHLTKRALGIVSVVWLMSCINTSYSRSDEIQVTGVEVDIIVGQFAHHGDAFYQSEVTRTQWLLVGNPDDFVARNDLASAYIKLKKYHEALSEFQLNEQKHPGKYETAANLGVLYKKMGQYGLAADHIKKSLEIKAEGHMGLGDYYLRMITWLKELEADPIYKKNFLGIPYSDPAEGIRVNKLVNKEYLMTLIKNDYQFADVYLVLGDVLLSEGDYELAVRSYYRASDLNHPREDVIEQKISDLHAIVAGMRNDKQVVNLRTVRSQVTGEFSQAKSWLKKYQVLEEERLTAGKPVDFKSMKGIAKVAGIEKPRVVEAILYDQEIVPKAWYDREGLVMALGMFAVVVTLVIFLIAKLVTKKPVNYWMIRFDDLKECLTDRRSTLFDHVDGAKVFHQATSQTTG